MKTKLSTRVDKAVTPRLSTMIITLSRAPPASAMMLVRPPLMALTKPSALTVATRLSRLDQVIVAEATGLPAASWATAWANRESLTYTRPLSSDTTTDVTCWPGPVDSLHTVARTESTSTLASRSHRASAESDFMSGTRSTKLAAEVWERQIFRRRTAFYVVWRP